MDSPHVPASSHRPVRMKAIEGGADIRGADTTGYYVDSAAVAITRPGSFSRLACTSNISGSKNCC